MAAQEIAPGLQRWTSWHEQWEDEVASLALQTSDGLVLIDPLATPEAFRKPDHVLLTVFWHGRETGEIEPKRVWSSTRSAQPLRNRGIEVTDRFRAGDALPGGVQAFQTARVTEVVFWLPDQRALAIGDVLLGAGAKPRPTDDALRLCPERWLGKSTHDDLRTSLQPVLGLPVEHVLVSHGQPVLGRGKEIFGALMA